MEEAGGSGEGRMRRHLSYVEEDEESPIARATSTIPTTIPYRDTPYSGSPASTPPYGSPQSLAYSTSFQDQSKGPLRRNASFLDDGARNVLAPTECGFPLPKKGQSLASFLSSGEFDSFMSPLDKENAHFYIAEAIIQAIEQSKCNSVKKKPDNEESSSEGEEVKVRWKKLMPRCRRKNARSKGLSRDGGSDAFSDTVTDYATSLSPMSSDKDDQSSGAESLESGESQAPMSAEGIALCLLRSFKEKRLPKASDLIWLVSESEVDQKLIPLPDSWPVSPDDDLASRMRGNRVWAPPRKQIIFNNIFKEGNSKQALAQQNNRCAGCGMKMTNSSRLRLCHYLGKYFCQLCHRNKKSVIPSRIVMKWDFTVYPVSNFALELLESLYCDPVFDLYSNNKNILTKSRTLGKVTEIRFMLIKVSHYVLICKNSNKERLLRIPNHLYTDQYKYSLNDFVKAKKQELIPALLDTYGRCVKHVLTCQLCREQGYVCEACRSEEIIFPFDVEKVLQCISCHACYHRKCVNMTGFQCKKCLRVRQRKSSETIHEAEEAIEAPCSRTSTPIS